MKYVLCGVPPGVDLDAIPTAGKRLQAYKRLGVYSSNTAANKAKLEWVASGWRAVVVEVKPFKFWEG